MGNGWFFTWACDVNLSPSHGSVSGTNKGAIPAKKYIVSVVYYNYNLYNVISFEFNHFSQGQYFLLSSVKIEMHKLCWISFKECLITFSMYRLLDTFHFYWLWWYPLYLTQQIRIHRIQVYNLSTLSFIKTTCKHFLWISDTPMNSMHRTNQYQKIYSVADNIYLMLILFLKVLSTKF